MAQSSLTWWAWKARSVASPAIIAALSAKSRFFSRLARRGSLASASSGVAGGSNRAR